MFVLMLFFAQRTQKGHCGYDDGLCDKNSYREREIVMQLNTTVIWSVTSVSLFSQWHSYDFTIQVMAYMQQAAISNKELISNYNPTEYLKM